MSMKSPLDDVVLTKGNQKVVDEGDLLQLVIWSASDEEIDCQYGKITMEEYCKLELERIEKGGWRRGKVLKQDGLVSLWVDEPLLAKIRKKKWMRDMELTEEKGGE